MKLEIYIPVSVIYDTETGECHLGEVGSESWPADMFGNIFDPEANDGDGEWHFWQNFQDEQNAAYYFLSEALADAHAARPKEVSDAGL